MLSMGNFKAHPATTIGGAFLGIFQAALMSATAAYTGGAGTSNWQTYAAAGAVGAVTFVAGGLMSSGDTSPPSPPQADTPPVDPKAAILAQIDAALAQAAHTAMLAEASKLTGVNFPAEQPALQGLL